MGNKSSRTNKSKMGKNVKISKSTSINQPVAMGYLPPALAAPGTRVDALVRGKPVPAEIVPMPFVKHAYYRG